MISGIYPVSGQGPQLFAREMALLAELPAQARTSRLATHAELRNAITALAERRDYHLMLVGTDIGFTATINDELRIVANVRGGGEETFYCHTTNQELVRELAEEIAKTCGPQLLFFGGDSDGTLIIGPQL